MKTKLAAALLFLALQPANAAQVDFGDTHAYRMRLFIEAEARCSHILPEAKVGIAIAGWTYVPDGTKKRVMDAIAENITGEVAANFCATMKRIHGDED